MEIFTSVGLPLITLGVMLFGLAAIVFLPVLPGLVIIWLAALVYGLVTGFSTVGIIISIIITALMIFGSLVDNILMGASASKTGASWWAITLALIAGMAGSFFWPPFGGLIASLVVLFAIEVIRLRNWRKALESTRSMALGCGWAVVARLGLGLVMISLWGIWVLIK
jgi:hypothetical protein